MEDKRKRGRPISSTSKKNQCLVKMGEIDSNYLDMLSSDLELSKPEVLRRALRAYFEDYYL